ncbi:MAG: hypothetical protein PHQ23_01960 [Candidatus Wallbacteria bacterium]|nr:hypothetical protein [Candidatus Wallbacteria bacterium]
MPATISIEFNQVLEMIDQFSPDEKERLSKYLDQSTLATRLQKFTDRMSDIPLTHGEITSEVEKVRKNLRK